MKTLKRVIDKEEILQEYVKNIEQLRPDIFIVCTANDNGYLIHMEGQYYTKYAYDTCVAFLQGIYYGIQL